MGIKMVVDVGCFGMVEKSDESEKISIDRLLIAFCYLSEVMISLYVSFDILSRFLPSPPPPCSTC